MRQIQSFLILSAVSLALLGILILSHLGGLLEPLWKNLIQTPAIHPGPNIVNAGSPLLGILSISCTLAVIWVGLRATIRELGLLAILAALLALGASLVAMLYGFYLPPVAPFLAIAGATLTMAAYQQTKAGSREPALRRLFGLRLRPEIFRRLVDGNLPVDFLGERHEASVLVCTVHNHVELMEALSPSDYVALMNLYLRAASDFLVDVGGYLDECSGESIRVIFGAPLPVEGASNHASKAAMASIDLVARLEELNRECDSRWQKRLDFRVGVNSGLMIAAAYGGARVGRYSVSGPVVDFARHLSAACAQYGCRILAGPLSYEMASTCVEGRPIDLLQRAGSRRRVELYEFLAPKNSLSPERERSRDQFWKGVILFRERKWEESIKALSSARIPGIPDRALDYYLERVERARRGDDEPTPEQALLAESV
jgi:adenylate cyclase